MGDHSDGLIMSHAHDLAAIYDLENASFGPGCSVCSLIENPPHLAITFRGTVAIVDSPGLVVPRAYGYPGTELLVGGKADDRRYDFSNDLLCRIHSQARYLRQSLHRILVRAEQIGNLLVELTHLLFEELQFLERHFDQTSIDRVELSASASASHNWAGVARKRLSARAARAAGSVSPSASVCSIRRALTPNRSVTKPDNLIWASSSKLSSWFCIRTCRRVICSLRRVIVRHRRCSGSGTKLRTSSCATSLFTRRSASGKSLFRPLRPRLDNACARCSFPDIAPAPSRFWQIGLQ